MIKKIVRQSIKIAMKTFLPRNRFMVSMPESENVVYLTFDDGPDPVETVRVLDSLKETGIKATFFVIGEKIKENPELVNRILDEGHTLGHHTYFHKQPNQVNAKQLEEEIDKTEKLLVGITGNTSNLFRPPLGKLSLPKIQALWKKNKSVCLWNNDPKDYSCNKLDDVLDHFKKQPIKSGDVVLMHDNQPYAAETIKYLVEQAEKSSLKFGTLSILQF